MTNPVDTAFPTSGPGNRGDVSALLKYRYPFVVQSVTELNGDDYSGHLYVRIAATDLRYKYDATEMGADDGSTILVDVAGNRFVLQPAPAGSTGETDNALLRADGTGGGALQGSLVTLDDDGILKATQFVVDGTTYAYRVNGSAGFGALSTYDSNGGAGFYCSHGVQTNTFFSVDAPEIDAAGGTVVYRLGRNTTQVTGGASELIVYAHDGTNNPKVRLQSDGDGIFTGDVSITGSLSKGSGSFRIPHPLAELAETRDLVHSFVEAPFADNIYRGVAELADGAAVVDLDACIGMTPGTFAALNRDVQVLLQNDTGWAALRGSVAGAVLSIECQDAGSSDAVTWLVIGRRRDAVILAADWTDENGDPVLEPERPRENREDGR